MNEPNREKEIFEQALDIASFEERVAFVENACAGDSGWAKRIKALLEADQLATSFLPGESERTAMESRLTPLSEGPGTQIDRYKLLQQIGEGGFGVVYMAEQREPVKRRVALKIIKLGMDTKQVVARFEAERQALAMMDHSNIAKVLDGGATETGRPYFVMELVKGTPITNYCDEQNLSTSDRLELFIKVCAAVQHAHQKGIIHRDLKPSNILVTMHDGVPVPKVIDFGIAKATQQELTEKTLFTEFHQFIGTPAYMSPEQAERSGLDIDTRSDIYSLGVLLYELLTGKPPFEARELLSAGFEEMRRIIREQEPMRPSTRVNTLNDGELNDLARHRKSDPRKLGAMIRGDLDWVVMKSLEKDRTRRYDTANDFSLDIKRYLTNEPVLARPPSTLYRFKKFTCRNRSVVLLTGGIALLLTTATIVSSTLVVRLNKANREVTKESGVNTAILGFFTHDLLGQASVGRTAKEGLELKDAIANASAVVGKRFPDRPDIERRVRIELGTIFQALGQQLEAREEFQRALELPSAEGAESSNDRVLLLKKISETSFALNDLDGAIQSLREARELGASLTPGGPMETWLKFSDGFMNNLYSPSDLAGGLKKLINESGEYGIRDELMRLLPGLQMEAGLHDDALASLESLLIDDAGVLKPITKSDLGQFLLLADCQRALKNFGEALPMIDRVIQAYQEEYSGESLSRRLSPCLVVKGKILTDMGEHDAGEVLLREAFDERAKNGPTGHLRLCSLSSLAWNLVAQGRIDDAIDRMEEAFSVVSRLDRPEVYDTEILRMAVQVEGASGQWQRGLDLCQREIANPRNANRSLLLQLQLGDETAFRRDRREFMVELSDSDDRIVLSELLRAASLRPVDSSELLQPALSGMVERLEGKLADSVPAMQTEIRLALAGAARLFGDPAKMLEWTGGVSTLDPLLQAQAKLHEGIAAALQERDGDAQRALAAVEETFPFLSEVTPDLTGFRWEDRLRTVQLHQELRRRATP